MPTTEEPAPPACCLMLVWISSRIVIAAMPPVASNLQITTNDGPAVNARDYDPLMAEQENGSSPLAEALARVGDRWTLLVVEALRLLAHWEPGTPTRRKPPGTPRAAPFSRPAGTARPATTSSTTSPATPRSAACNAGTGRSPCTLSSPESTSRSGAAGWRGTDCDDRADDRRDRPRAAAHGLHVPRPRRAAAHSETGAPGLSRP